MEEQTSSIRQSSMFLIELIIAVLFLSLCSAICVRLFVSSRLTASESYERTQAVNVAQNIAEVFEAQVDGAEYFLYSGSESKNQDQYDVVIYYDDDFSACEMENAVYEADVMISSTEYLYSADISIRKKSDSGTADSIYDLHVDRAINQLGGAF